MRMLVAPPPDSGCGVLVLIVIVSFAVLSIILTSAKHYRLRQSIERFAKELRGEIVPLGFFRDPAVRFNVAGREARLEFSRGGVGQAPFARVVVNVVGLFPGVLHIIPAGFGMEFLKLFGSQDLLVGDKQFDDEYVIKSNPESLATNLFRPDQRAEVIRAVRRLEWYPASRISLDRMNLTVQVFHYTPEAGHLMVLVEVATGFMRYLSSPPKAVGVEVVEVRAVPGGECPVCGSTMSRNTVRCAICRTPHHAECWEYMGRCSTYACKGKRGVA